MEHRILIVDDDQIFNTLLSDVFKQASYVVESVFSADEAIETLKSEKFDLVVTDQRMPGTSGTQLVRHIMKEHKGLHVVMVSGYLSNDDIRQLIRDGVGGVFIKPLNIFQLLKRAAQLLAKPKSNVANNEDNGSTAAVNTGEVSCFHGARSPAAQRFIKQLTNLRSFSSNLLLVGQNGTDFDSVCEDLANSQTDTVFSLDATDLDDESVLAARLGGMATKQSGCLTIVLKQIEQLGEKRAETVFSIARARPPFDHLGQQTRFVFCLKDNLDDMFDAGRIDENLYLFMGTMELKIPSLKELKEDLPDMAQCFLDREAGSPCRLDSEAQALLPKLNWTGDMLQFKQVLRKAASFCSNSIISASILNAAFEDKLGVKEEAQPVSGLKEHLEQLRNSYALAMLNLNGGDADAAAKALGTSADFVMNIARQSSKAAG